MYKTVRSIVLGAFLGATCMVAAPQEPQNNSKPMINREATMPERLALTADQKTQFRAIVQNRRDQVEAIRNDTSLSAAARKEKMKAVRMDSNAKIRAMLNENQLAEYDQILRERHEKAIRNKQTALPPQ